MKFLKTFKPLLVAFLIALAIYLVSYNLIEHRRTRRGPWLVTFTHQSGAPVIVINEMSLNISNFEIIFPGEKNTNEAATLMFASPEPVPFDLPFGQCIFEDTTFQPGTVVFKCFGHEIQLLPRVLTIDKKEYAWNATAKMELNKAGILPGAP